MDPGTLQFDGWTVDRVSGEMSRDGHMTRLPQQPLRILIELADRAGAVVTREQLVKALWPQGVVDFDNGLNVAVRKLRVALDDVGDTPRYVETLPRVGYRFIGNLGAPTPPATVESTLPRSARGMWLLLGLVVVALVVALGVFRFNERSAGETRHVPSARAQELYVEGMHERSRRDIDATALALAKLEEAIKEDPQYAEAWAGYSRALSGAVVRQLTTPAEGLPKARAAAERALMLDPTVADAHVTLLHIHMDFDKDFAAATRDMEKARQLGLDTASFWHYSAMWHGQQGRVEEALADMRRARALEPMTLGAWQGDLGVLYVKTGRREDALREIARLATLQSQGFGESYEIATIQAALGELDPACESLARALTDKSFLVNWMRLDPRMDPLRGRKCFTDVEGKLYGDSKGTG